MALITCPACNKQVSDTAPACPSCGEPISKAKDAPAVAGSATPRQAGKGGTKLLVAGVLLAVLAVAAYFGYNWFRDNYAPPDFNNIRVEAKRDRADFGTILVTLINDSQSPLSDVSVNVSASLPDGDNPANVEEWPTWNPNEKKEVRIRQIVDIRVRGGNIVQSATKTGIRRLDVKGLATKDGRRVAIMKSTTDLPVQD